MLSRVATISSSITRCPHGVTDRIRTAVQVLGPITLSLLGLDLFISGEGGVPIVVDLNAEPGGGLLGGLLCGLAGGVPITGPLDQLLQIIEALNTLLGLLG
jgi:hypothetical protein